MYEKFYCACGDMESRIKEQMCLFANRLSTDEMKANPTRLHFSALVEALRRMSLDGTEWAHAPLGTIQLKLLNLSTW